MKRKARIYLILNILGLVFDFVLLGMALSSPYCFVQVFGLYWVALAVYICFRIYRYHKMLTEDDK